MIDLKQRDDGDDQKNRRDFVLATTSLPVPLSPVISVVIEDRLVIFLTFAMTSLKRGD